MLWYNSWYVAERERAHNTNTDISQSILIGSKEESGGTVDYDSYLWPLIQDLKVLATEGVDAKEYDSTLGRLKEETFKLRAHLITVCACAGICQP